MAAHRFRRWFQFGILDVLILTAVVAVAVSLCRPVKVQVNTARPWVVGQWENGNLGLCLMPDGSYCQWLYKNEGMATGFGWAMAPPKMAGNACVLSCGELRFVVRSESGSGVMEWLNDDGSNRLRLELRLALRGPVQNEMPHGTWTLHQDQPISSSREHASL